MTLPDPSAKERAIRASGIRFLREQDGESERLLKGRLVESFMERDEVQRAYLVQISWGDQSGVALCPFGLPLVMTGEIGMAVGAASTGGARAASFVGLCSLD